VPGVEALGDDRLSCLRLCGPEGEETVPASGLYILLGRHQYGLAADKILRDANGFLLSGGDLKVDGKMIKSWNQPRDHIFWRPACRAFLSPAMSATDR